MRLLSGTLLFCLMFCQFGASAQHFKVQIAAYSEQQPPAYFQEHGVFNYSESVDPSGIFWYYTGACETREIADTVQQDMVSKGFRYALVIDLDEQKLLSNADCPFIRNGVVFVKNPHTDTTKQVIYFDAGGSELDAKAKTQLDEVYAKLKENRNLTLRIAGYTDGVGDAVTNLNLSASRSRAARNYLIYKGIRADRMIMEIYGEADPAAPNTEDDGSNNGKGKDLPENRRFNRRVVLTLENPDNPVNPK